MSHFMPATQTFVVPDTRRPGALLPLMSLRMPPGLVADLDGHAARLGCSRAALSRALLVQGVAQLRDARPSAGTHPDPRIDVSYGVQY